MKKYFFLFVILSTTPIFSQFKITGYFDTEVGLTYQFSDRIQTELRINDNLGIEFNSKLSLLYTIFSKENYNLSFGLGISTFPFHSKNTAFFESYFLPFQIAITPFKEVTNFGFVLESAYHLSNYEDASGIRNSIGIRYIFK
tara:strand:+ start:85 stop:510 length:426 start_codon:yes stop_codon:yes gene_type:complete